MRYGRYRDHAPCAHLDVAFSTYDRKTKMRGKRSALMRANTDRKLRSATNHDLQGLGGDLMTRMITSFPSGMTRIYTKLYVCTVIPFAILLGDRLSRSFDSLQQTAFNGSAPAVPGLCRLRLRSCLDKASRHPSGPFLTHGCHQAFRRLSRVLLGLSSAVGLVYSKSAVRTLVPTLAPRGRTSVLLSGSLG